jgi:hypothetical protein
LNDAHWENSGYERAEGVRLQFIRARSDLDNHIQQHGCTVAEGVLGHVNDELNVRLREFAQAGDNSGPLRHGS